MPKQVQPLAVSTIKNAKAKPNAYRLADGHGLSILVQPSGTKA